MIGAGRPGQGAGTARSGRRLLARLRPVKPPRRPRRRRAGRRQSLAEPLSGGVNLGGSRPRWPERVAPARRPRHGTAIEADDRRGRTHRAARPVPGRSQRPARPHSRERCGLVPPEQGLSNRAIARRLCRSERTIEHHVSSLFAKLGIASRSELESPARNLGTANASTQRLDSIPFSQVDACGRRLIRRPTRQPHPPIDSKDIDHEIPQDPAPDQEPHRSHVTAGGMAVTGIASSATVGGSPDDGICAAPHPRRTPAR